MNGRERVEMLAQQVVATCGLGRVLVVGDDAPALAERLRFAGCDAGVLRGQAIAELGRRAPASCDTVVALAPVDDEAAAKDLLVACRRVTARDVVVALADESMTGNSPQVRERWERAAVAAGMHKHPRYYDLNVYELLDRHDTAVTLPFERVDDEALVRWPLEQLQRNRQLHMDMLREVGRRGDAHCVRYVKAAAFVRPGDRVLDLACGYGYGSHLLYQNSLAASVLGMDLDAGAIDYARANYAHGEAVQFVAGDAQALSKLPDASVDFIASFETIEHLPEPERYLDELRRVLRPAGRLMICAPNDWADETGKDPNPHHLHVYTWQRLRDEVGARFLLERGFVQTAGGAVKCHHAPRAWEEVPLAPLKGEAEWILLLAMKTPLGAEAVPYVETSWHLPKDEAFHVSAFGRDYDNPWLVKAMVTRGMRLEQPAELRRLVDAVLASSRPDSVDRGAALCGLGYRLLSENGRVSNQVGGFQAAIDDYAALRDPEPHQLRWQVSLLFVGGELALRAGDRAMARRRYEQCAALDPVPYSPLLGNRTLDAHFRLAVMDLVDGDVGAAKQRLLRSVAEARRLTTGSWLNVVGDPDHPLPFGLAELAQLLDRASRAAYALQQIDTARLRPGAFVREATGWFERVLGFKDDHVAAAQRGSRAHARRVNELEAQLRELEGVIRAQSSDAEARPVHRGEQSRGPQQPSARLSEWLGRLFGRRR